MFLGVAGFSRWQYGRGLGGLRYLALRRLDCLQCTLNGRDRARTFTSFLHNRRSSVVSAVEPLSRRVGLYGSCEGSGLSKGEGPFLRYRGKPRLGIDNAKSLAAKYLHKALGVLLQT